MIGTMLRGNLIAVSARCLLSVLVLITVLTVFVPFYPYMPVNGVDGSWIYAMDEMVARNLRIGKDIIFTFGPYASIYTRSFNSATDHLMLLGSLVLGLSYVLLLLHIGKGRPAWRLLAIVFFLVGMMHSPPDTLFFSYPLLLAVCAAKHAVEKNVRRITWQLMAMFLVFSPLGLLPLVKGTLLLICGVTAIAIVLYFSYHGKRDAAWIAAFSPLLTITGFWMFSGQAISDLPGYFISMSPIISGYTEAMAGQGKNIEMLVYLGVVSVIIATLLTSHSLPTSAKVFLSVCFTLFYFISFKAGFVRHDLHAIIAGTSLLFSALLVNLIVAEKRTFLMLFVSIGAWYYIDANYTEISAGKIIEKTRNAYLAAWAGLYVRITEKNFFQQRFASGLANVRKECPIPKLQGSTDIYSAQQSCLLASENTWNPRPVFQSYSVYTPSLALLNEQHLRGGNAPDNVLFRVEPIDFRLPTLEDGLSWPALFDNYTVTQFDGDLAFLRKKPSLKANSDYIVVSEGSYQTGEAVAIPQTNAPLYAELELKQTLLGRLVSVVFKPPQLALNVTFNNGVTDSYRVLSNMMQSGFFLSPLAKSTTDFVFLATNHPQYLENNRVKSLAIVPSYGDSILWSKDYKLKLKAYQQTSVTALPDKLFDTIDGVFPAGYTEAKQAKTCDGSMDKVNGSAPAPGKTNAVGILSVEGWLAVSGKDGVAADEIFVTLTDKTGSTHYVKAKHTPRNDVKAFFKQLSMPDVGYTAIFDVSALGGEYVLGLARAYKGQLEPCASPALPVTIGNAE